MHAGVLIAAARGSSIIPVRAHAILDDAERTFVTSDYIRMEVLPKALYHRQSQEVLLYERFFARAIQIVPPFVSLSRGIERVDRKRQVTRGAADKIRAHHQPQNRQGAGPHYPPYAPRPGRRGDPVSLPAC